MKSILFSLLTFISISACAQQDKSQRPSPPATITETIASGAKITIEYSQPSLKGRAIGTDVATFGKVWRTGANEATVFETDKDIKVEGKTLAAGKYGLYSIPGQTEWVIIFNKTWKQWGTRYTEADDALRVTVKPSSVDAITEKMTFTIDKNGKITLLWGNTTAAFTVQ